GLTVEKIQDLITWISNDKFWRTTILSPEKLREQFQNLEIKREGDREKELIAKNKNYALYLKKKHPDRLKTLSFTDKYVINLNTPDKEISLNMNNEAFKAAIIALFGGVYNGRRDSVG